MLSGQIAPETRFRGCQRESLCITDRDSAAEAHLGAVWDGSQNVYNRMPRQNLPRQPATRSHFQTLAPLLALSFPFCPSWDLDMFSNRPKPLSGPTGSEVRNSVLQAEEWR
jgi:hypothetical protein